MSPKQQRPYGLWDSPVEPAHLSAAIRFRDVAWDSDGRTLVWLEGRGADNVIVCQSRPDEAPRDLTTGYRVRAQVGYGGGEFTVARGRLYFAEASGRLYARDLAGGEPRALTPAFGSPASPTVSADGRWVAYVHTYEGEDRLALVDSAGSQWPQVLASGADFYMQPAWHPRGRWLAWVEWDHPQMPWDGTRLQLARLRRPGDGAPRVAEVVTVAGSVDTAAGQPTFSPDGRSLAYLSDEGGWSQLWLHDLESGARRCLCTDEVDVGLPAWVQGVRVFTFSADSRQIFFSRTEGGPRRVYALEVGDGGPQAVSELAHLSHADQIAAAPRGSGLAFVGGSSQCPPRVMSLRRGRLFVHARSTGESLAPDTLSAPRAVSWSAADGNTVQGLYYAPMSAAFEAEGAPPLLVDIHGGPTGQVRASFDAEVQYFTTRGYAVLAVNYRGSTGCGRRYMEALRGNWGIYDVEDAVGGARHLVEIGLADASRLIIAGGSAGGYTVLRALTVHPGFFRAGLCSYGISNLLALASGTHKFEARYLDTMLGPLPRAAEAYRERSPLFAADRLVDPVAIFQGADDEVVPRAQSDALVESLRRRGVPHLYMIFEGEGHGWRRPETIDAYIRAVEAFLKEHVLFA